jgi:amino acid permease
MKNLYASMLLIAATSIGAAILFFPMMLGTTSLILAIGLLLLIWIVMNYAGFLFLEITLWFPPNSHFMTMGKKLLGRPIAFLCASLYLVMMYLLLFVYLNGLTIFLSNIFNDLSFSSQNIYLILFSTVLLVAIAFYFFRHKVNYFIVSVVCLFLLCLILFFILSAPHIHSTLVIGGGVETLLGAIPLTLIAFSYHFIIPRVRDGIEGEKFKNARRIIFFGGLLLLLIYALWLLMIFSAVHQWIFIAQIMCFLALTVSFLTVANSFYNFAAMTFNHTRYRQNKLFLLSFIFAPPLIYTLFFSYSIIYLITLIGILVTILYIIAPAVMVWSGRHSKEFSFGYRVKGGRFILIGLILLGVLLVGLQMYSLIR